ncbi:MAG: SDR family oxidoreductase [Myxococcaceae bacterium]|nr:SDR family oxidoreductase [Myxococcaceae bacterium]
MSDRFEAVTAELRARPRRWLVTGAAGFIGSNLVEWLLANGQEVVGFDNFATGHRRNLPAAGDSRFTFIEADVRELGACREACRGVDIVLHQAALGSVPRSLKDPLTTHEVNVTGTLHLLLAAKDAGVKRFVYASSSSVYGDEPALPKVEDRVGKALSPYAASKQADELYAQIVTDAYRLETIGLRYFNVFGRRQDPEGAYAAVIPRWVAALLRHEVCTIFGDGETSRDFCYVDNVVQANVLAAMAPPKSTAVNRVYNIACGERTTLKQLYRMIRDRLAEVDPVIGVLEPAYENERPGDIRHSQADISRAKEHLGYQPVYGVAEGLDRTMAWYVEQARTAGDQGSRFA